MKSLKKLPTAVNVALLEDEELKALKAVREKKFDGEKLKFIMNKGDYDFVFHLAKNFDAGT